MEAAPPTPYSSPPPPPEYSSPSPAPECSSPPPPPEYSSPSPAPECSSPPPPPPEYSSPPPPPEYSSPPPPPEYSSPPAPINEAPSRGGEVPPPLFDSTPPPPSSVPKPPSSKRATSTAMIAGLTIGGVAILAMLSFSLLFLYYKKKDKERRNAGSAEYLGPPPPTGLKAEPYDGAVSPPPAPELLPSPRTGRFSFSYEELVRATDGFSDANFLGKGGFGYVHKGDLPTGEEVAVKRLQAVSQQGEREFRTEVEIISRVHHKHLVSLLGHCISGSERLLVYEFVPNKTLEFHLHGKGRIPINWPTRLKIALGAAKGLAYLHEECHPKIIHRDIKSANILVDSSFEAKVADFGLAKFVPDFNSHVSTQIMGTFGYLAPEYASSGRITDKSDVFSFGVVLLELITGRRSIYYSTEALMPSSLVEWARPLLTPALEEGNFDSLVDPRLQNSYDKNEMARIVTFAAASVSNSVEDRPQMSQIVRALEGGVSLYGFNEGIRSRPSMVYSSHESSEYGITQYNEDMKNFRKMARQSKDSGSSEYPTPEWASSEKLTEKSDVFSFGVVLQELITGRRPVYSTPESVMPASLVDWARPLLTQALGKGNFESLVDPRLQNNYNKNEMARIVAFAAASVRPSAKQRPRMSQIVGASDGDVSLNNFNDGIRAEQSTVYYNSLGSSEYDIARYSEDMKNFRKMAPRSKDSGSSEYGADSEQ
ncbi:hypothetical protein ACH5RR_004212 [Cinchona calisaya]|uniref:non-specific serine/threonine protein kinase n=1 Tax=Cinchona calisaya TaxID=153742 RepID=A0ABD3AX18_9GENT